MNLAKRLVLVTTICAVAAIRYGGPLFAQPGENVAANPAITPKPAGAAAAARGEQSPLRTSKTPQTRLYVRTIPPGADVKVDGKPLGPSDGLFLVPPGVRSITLEMDGFDPEARRVDVRDGWVTRVEVTLKKQPAAAKPEQQQGKVEPPAPAGLPASAVRLSHVDGTAEGKQSYGGTGFGVEFERPKTASLVAAIQLYASRYGNPDPPAEDFHIYLLNEHQKVIKDFPIPYARIEWAGSGEKWYTFRITPTEVPEKFFVGLSFNANQYKGVYVGKDTDVTESHSYTGLPDTGYKPVKDRLDWMVIAYVVNQEDAKKMAAAPQESAKAASPSELPPELQPQGREILRKLAEANRYWLSGPPDEVKRYQYEYHRVEQPDRKVEVTPRNRENGSMRQGTTYYSILHLAARDPEQVSFQRIETSKERITMEYVLSEPLHVAIGNGVVGEGVGNSWYGFFSMPVKEGTIVLDAVRFTPLEHMAEGLHETFGQYVDLGDSHYAPLELGIEHETMKFTWTFRVYEPGLWLLGQARYSLQEGIIASVAAVKVNGKEAKVLHAAK